MNANVGRSGRARRPLAPTNVRGIVDSVGRRKLPHDVPLWTKNDHEIFFITICCKPRNLNQLCLPDVASAIFETIDFRNQRGDRFVHLALLMPDHLHALISFPATAELRKTIRTWNSFVARTIKINWQRDFFDHRLRGDESYREKADYVLANPTRAGLCGTSEGWPYTWIPEQVGATEPSRPTV
jgi:putative transposase